MTGPDPRNPRVKQLVQSVKRRVLVTTARCFKACFMGEDGRPTYEGERALADLRNFARLGLGPQDHLFLRDLEGRIDPLSMARMEGRREVVRRIAAMLELNPDAVQQFVEVDNEA